MVESDSTHNFLELDDYVVGQDQLTEVMGPKMINIKVKKGFGAVKSKEGHQALASKLQIKTEKERVWNKQQMNLQYAPIRELVDLDLHLGRRK